MNKKLLIIGGIGGIGVLSLGLILYKYMMAKINKLEL